MSLSNFLDSNGVLDGFPPGLINAFDIAGGPALIQMYGVPPGPPIMGVPSFAPAVMSAIPTPGPGLLPWLNLIALDVTLLIQVPMLVGSILQMTPAKGAAPATPITPTAQAAQPGALSPSAEKAMKTIKAITEWCVSMILPADIRLLGKFTVIQPPIPSSEQILPVIPSIESILISALAGLALSQDEKNTLISNIISQIEQTNQNTTPNTQMPEENGRSPQRGDPGRVLVRVEFPCD